LDPLSTLTGLGTGKNTIVEITGLVVLYLRIDSVHTGSRRLAAMFFFQVGANEHYREKRLVIGH
jgi:hypothetical protein